MSTCLLIDGNNIMFAAQTRKGIRLRAGDVETTAVFGTLGSLRELAERFPGASQFVLWDHSPTWRHAEYPDYKGKRDQNQAIREAKESIKRQRPILSRVLQTLDLAEVSAPGYEADDLGGLLSRKFARRGTNVVCVTNDRDWLQLVDTTVDWFDPREKKLVSAVSFMADTGYESQDQFVQAKALTGDVSDNLPGVGGIGEGCAPLIMQEFGSVDALRAGWGAFYPKIVKGHPFSRYKKRIADFLDSADGDAIYRRNIRFMDLRAVNVPQEAIQIRRGRHDEQAFKRICQKLAFHSLLTDYERWYAPFVKGRATT